MSQLGWIDFSPDDRNKVKNVLAMLSEPGTLDELGIGQVRDGFSGLLFPWVSTIQTRAKYFIIVPRILRDYQALKPAQKKNKTLQKYLLEQENKVAQILDGIHDNNTKGIVGRTRIKSGGVDRRPSVIYWNGLRVLGLVNTKLSLTDFGRQLDNAYHYDEYTHVIHDEGSDDHDSLKSRNLVCIPDLDNSWMDKLRLELSHKESQLLKDKITGTAAISNTIPAQLFKHDLLSEVLNVNVNANSKTEAFDELTAILLKDVVDESCKHYLKAAQEFSLAMEGPHIRYNIQLAKNNDYTHCVDEYQDAYEEWQEKVKTQNLFNSGCADKWLNIAANNGQRNINPVSKKFIQDCCEILEQYNDPKNLLHKRVLIQAERNKGSRSLLKHKLTKDDWVGIRRLDYRWSSAKIIINDIREGLNAST